MELPCNSVGIITPDEMKTERLHDRYETCMVLPAGTLSAAWEFIKANPGKSLANMADAALKPLFPAGTLNYRVGVAYRCFETLLAEGRIRIESHNVVTSQGVPGTTFSLYAVEK